MPAEENIHASDAFLRVPPHAGALPLTSTIAADNRGGLATAEARARLMEFGPSAVIEGKTSIHHHGFPAHDRTFQMSVGIVFTRVMPILPNRFSGGKIFQPDIAGRGGGRVHRKTEAARKNLHHPSRIRTSPVSTANPATARASSRLPSFGEATRKVSPKCIVNRDPRFRSRANTLRSAVCHFFRKVQTGTRIVPKQESPRRRIVCGPCFGDMLGTVIARFCSFVCPNGHGPDLNQQFIPDKEQG